MTVSASSKHTVAWSAAAALCNLKRFAYIQETLCCLGTLCQTTFYYLYCLSWFYAHMVYILHHMFMFNQATTD